MAKIIYFNNDEEFDKFLVERIIKKVGEGSEGKCYLGIDGYAYKEYNLGDEIFSSETLDYKKIITADEYSSKYILFPLELYVVRDDLRGYKTLYVKNNIFNILTFNEEILKSIDSKKMIKAYERFQNEIKLLSKSGIKIFDLSCNLLFNYKSFYAVDTVEYYFDKSHDSKKIETTNLSLFDNAIEDFFDDFLSSMGKRSYNIDHDFEYFFSMIKSEFVDNQAMTKSIKKR